MAVNENSDAVNKNTKSRFGCSVCQKKNLKDSLFLNSWTNKLKLETKEKANDSNTEYEKCKQLLIQSKECYCNHMKQIQNKAIPRLICSKSYKTPNHIAVDNDWLNEMKEFRRENWFDCHSDSFFDTDFMTNINSLSIFEEHELNCNHLHDLILLDHTECNNLKTKSANMCLKNSATKEYIHNKITKQKFAGENKNIPKEVVNKPWIPPSVSY